MAFFYTNEKTKSRYFVEIFQKVAKSLITQMGDPLKIKKNP